MATCVSCLTSRFHSWKGCPSMLQAHPLLISRSVHSISPIGILERWPCYRTQDHGGTKGVADTRRQSRRPFRGDHQGQHYSMLSCTSPKSQVALGPPLLTIEDEKERSPEADWATRTRLNPQTRPVRRSPTPDNSSFLIRSGRQTSPLLDGVRVITLTSSASLSHVVWHTDMPPWHNYGGISVCHTRGGWTRAAYSCLDRPCFGMFAAAAKHRLAATARAYVLAFDPDATIACFSANEIDAIGLLDQIWLGGLMTGVSPPRPARRKGTTAGNNEPRIARGLAVHGPCRSRKNRPAGYWHY